MQEVQGSIPCRSTLSKVPPRNGGIFIYAGMVQCLHPMSPTVFRYRKYRFYFFSREETRVHVHVTCPDGEAKFWIEPGISLAQNYGLSQRQVKTLMRVVEEHKDEITSAWREHFSR
ncbi:MAG TPA: hypothetical protein DCM05_09185 [Elusimicrobia bacterium]|nr:hypothetical protein [Elusimicrobiota bacterium]